MILPIYDRLMVYAQNMVTAYRESDDTTRLNLLRMTRDELQLIDRMLTHIGDCEDINALRLIVTAELATLEVQL